MKLRKYSTTTKITTKFAWLPKTVDGKEGKVDIWLEHYRCSTRYTPHGELCKDYKEIE
jgi:hypothetical protein